MVKVTVERAVERFTGGQFLEIYLGGQTFFAYGCEMLAPVFEVAFAHRAPSPGARRARAGTLACTTMRL